MSSKNQLQGLVGSAELNQQIAVAASKVQNIVSTTSNSGNGPMFTFGIIIMLAGAGYFIWKKFFGPSGFALTLSNLDPNSQNAIANFIEFQNQINFSLDTAPTQFGVSYLMLNGNQCGIVLSNSTNTVIVYLTYAEYLNWYATSGATLSVPVRTLTNNTLVDSITNGYKISYDNVNLVFQISSLAQKTSSSIQYTDASGNVKTVSTASVPSISATTVATAHSEFIAKTSLDTITQALLNQNVRQISSIAFQYNSGTQTTPGSSLPLTLSELQLNGVPSGYQLVSANKAINLYLTYKEALHICEVTSTTSYALPLRTLVNSAPLKLTKNNSIIDDMTGGYIYTSPTPTSVVIYPSAAPVTEAAIANANVADIYNQGLTYPFYVTYDMLGATAETLINTFIARQSLVRYTINGVTASVSVVHTALNSINSGLTLSVDSGTQVYAVYASYNEIINWLLSDFRSAGSNASLVLPVRVQSTVSIGTFTASILVPATDNTSGSYTLAFDATNNALINVSYSPNTISTSSVTYNNTAVNPVAVVTIDANTGA